VRTDALALVLLAALAAGGCAGHAAGMRADALPSDVVGFVERRVLCEHFLGEEPYDEERRQFLERSVEATCRGTDAALAALRMRYRDEPDIVERLAEFEYPLGY
jgi:hypothetical protein